MACHRKIEERLATLERAAAALADQPEEAAAALRSAVRFLDTNGAWHTLDEDESVFPRLRPLLSVGELAAMYALEGQHGEAESLFSELKAALAGLPAATASIPPLVERFAEHYRNHIRLEEETLIPMADRFLTEADLTAIAAEMKDRRGVK